MIELPVTLTSTGGAVSFASPGAVADGIPATFEDERFLVKL